MPRDVVFSTAEDRIDTCIDSSGDDLLEKQTGSDETDYLWVAQRGSYNYSVDYPGDSDHFNVNLGYNIIDTVARVISEEDTETILEVEEVDTSQLNDEEKYLKAAGILLDNTPRDIQRSFANDIVQLLSHPKLSYEFRTTEEGAITAYQLTKAIYPFSGDFTYQEFNDTVQTVVTIGHSAQSYANMCLDVQSAIDDHKPDDPLPYMQ